EEIHRLGPGCICASRFQAHARHHSALRGGRPSVQPGHALDGELVFRPRFRPMRRHAMGEVRDRFIGNLLPHAVENENGGFGYGLFRGCGHRAFLSFRNRENVTTCRRVPASRALPAGGMRIDHPVPSFGGIFPGYFSRFPLYSHPKEPSMNLRGILAAASLFAAASGAIAQTQTLQVAGVTRNYILHAPAGLGEKPPLVFVIHGFNMTGQQEVNLTRMNAVADREKFIVVYPNALPNGSNQQSWDMSGPNDFAYLLAIIDSVDARHGIDRNKVYA